MRGQFPDERKIARTFSGFHGFIHKTKGPDCMTTEHTTTPAGPAKQSSRKGCALLLILLTASLAGGWYFLSRRNSKNEKPAGQRSIPVVTAKSTRGNMDIYLTGLGSVSALNTVTVHSRADGHI